MRRRSMNRRFRPVGDLESDTGGPGSRGSETLCCRTCGVFGYATGWSWEAPSGAEVQPATCPACRRIHDRYPAGTIRLHGDLGAMRDELLEMIRSVEEQEKAEYPLERLMQVDQQPAALVITTTGIHLARCIASALTRRFHGTVRLRYDAEETQVSVDWTP